MIHVQGRSLLIAAAVVIAAAIAAALSVMGLPEQQRQLRMDERRVQDLQRIEAAIQAHARLHDALPANLAGIEPATALGLTLAEPDTGAPYGYRPGEGGRFELCAVFATESAAAGRAAAGDWLHPAGPHCFQRRLAVAAGARR
jgi:type II secretory pathway pseudopilin PulG